MITQEDIERWLRENTKQCPLGRVSKWQCEQNRSKPSRCSHRYSYKEKPIKCESCEEWKTIFRE